MKPIQTSKRFRVFSFALIALTSFPSCAHKKVTWDQEVIASRKTSEWLDSKFGTIVDPEIDLFLQRIAQRLANSAHGRDLDHFHTSTLVASPSMTLWHVALVNTPEVNAFSSGGGVIYVTRGLLENIESESQLAAIVAHEMSHQILGHTQAALSDSLSQSNAEESGSDTTSDSGPAPQVAYSLDQELDADRLSLGLVIAARYQAESTLEALSLAYRLGQKNVHPVADPVFTKRAAALRQKITEEGLLYPGTVTTREFGKVQRLLP